jgi:glycosyltransferase involved in cell wall biosynthesis
MKVLAAIVMAPHWLTAGGPNAALRLSAAVSTRCDIDVARMAAADATTADGRLRVLDFGCSNPLSFARGVLPGGVLTPFYRARIPELVRTRQYDLVHIHNPLPALEMKRVADACRAVGVPYVVSTHGLVELASRGRALDFGLLQRIAWRPLIDRPFRDVLRHAARVMALSPADLPFLSEFGCDLERVSIVPNGVRVPDVEVEEDEVERVCRTFGLPFPKPPGVPVGMFLANHTKNKGVLILLEAFGGCALPFRLIVAGGQRSYVGYDRYTGVAGAGRFHFPGFVADEDLAPLMAYSDLFVFPTLSDTFPLVLLEAMAHGLPVLSTRVGGIPYQVPDSCGLLVEPGSPQALIDGFAHLTRDMDRLAAMGKAARAHVSRHFSWDASAAAAISVYRSILAVRTTASARGPEAAAPTA